MNKLLLHWRKEHLLNTSDVNKFQSLARVMLVSIKNMQVYDNTTQKNILAKALQATFKYQLAQELTNILADELLANADVFWELHQDNITLGSANPASIISKTKTTSLSTMATSLQRQILASMTDLLFSYCLKTNGSLCSTTFAHQGTSAQHVDLSLNTATLASSANTTAANHEIQRIQQYQHAYQTQQQWDSQYHALRTQLFQAINAYQSYKAPYLSAFKDSTLSEEEICSQILAAERQQRTSQYSAIISQYLHNNFIPTNSTPVTNQSIRPQLYSFASHCLVHMEAMSQTIIQNPDRGFDRHAWKFWKRPRIHGLDYYSQDYTPERLNYRYQQAMQQQLQLLPQTHPTRIVQEPTPQNVTRASLPVPHSVSIPGSTTSTAVPSLYSSVQNHHTPAGTPTNIAIGTPQIYPTSDLIINRNRLAKKRVLSPDNYRPSSASSINSTIHSNLAPTPNTSGIHSPQPVATTQVSQNIDSNNSLHTHTGTTNTRLAKRSGTTIIHV